ncbi:hypothetical protein SAMN05216299_10234 [Nitrosospira sp. Nsp14]|nr:hypothetical protein SAMN05216299_10234 [Nitrosospira sp. Nsp14]
MHRWDAIRQMPWANRPLSMEEADHGLGLCSGEQVKQLKQRPEVYESYLMNGGQGALGVREWTITARAPYTYGTHAMAMHETSYDANVTIKRHVKTIRLSQNGRSAPDSIVTLNVRDPPIEMGGIAGYCSCLQIFIARKHPQTEQYHPRRDTSPIEPRSSRGAHTRDFPIGDACLTG